MKNFKRFQNLILILLSLFILTSCSSDIVIPEPPIPEVEYIKLDVPYVQQPKGSNWCVPASGTMIFNFYDTNVTINQVADNVINEDTGLGSTAKLIAYAKELGFKATSHNFTSEELIEVLKQGIPVIVGQDYSLIYDIPHTRVYIGLDDKLKEFITNDPSSLLGEDYHIPYSEAIALNTSKPPYFHTIIITPENVDFILP